MKTTWRESRIYPEMRLGATPLVIGRLPRKCRSRLLGTRLETACKHPVELIGDFHAKGV